MMDEMRIAKKVAKREAGIDSTELEEMQDYVQSDIIMYIEDDLIHFVDDAKDWMAFDTNKSQRAIAQARKLFSDASRKLIEGNRKLTEAHEGRDRYEPY